MRRLGSMVLLASLAGVVQAQTDADMLRLVVMTIKPIPFCLLFHDSTNVVAGMRVNGFVVTAVTPTEITLGRSNRTFVLPRATNHPYNQYQVELMNETDGTRYMVQNGEEFHVGTHALRLQKVDSMGSICVLLDVESGKEIIVRRMVTPPHPVERSAQAAQSRAGSNETQRTIGGKEEPAPQP